MSGYVSRVRSLLAGITPGPWAHYGDLTHEVYPTNGNHDDEPDNIASEVPRLADAAFIAEAPAAVTHLLARLDAVEALAAEFDSEAAASRAVVENIIYSSKRLSDLDRLEISQHRHHATIAENHAKRIRAALAGEG